MQFDFHSTIGDRARNEDSIYAGVLAGDTVLLAVADGVGGYPNGAAASQTAIATAWDLASKYEPTQTGMTQYFQAINQEVGCTGGYTTLTVVFILQASTPTPTVVCANVGDSSAHIICQRARRLRPISVRHGWGNLLDRALGTTTSSANRWRSIQFPSHPDVTIVRMRAAHKLVGVLVTSDGCDYILEDPKDAAAYGKQLQWGTTAQQVVADATTAWRRRSADPVDNTSAALLWLPTGT